MPFTQNTPLVPYFLPLNLRPNMGRLTKPMGQQTQIQSPPIPLWGFQISEAQPKFDGLTRILHKKNHKTFKIKIRTKEKGNELIKQNT